MTDENLPSIMVRDLVYLLRNRRIDGGVIWAEGDVGRLDEGRNKVADEFVRSSNDWMLWIDTDMAFTANDFDKLLARAKMGNLIVSGLYYRATNPPTPCMMRYKDGRVRVLKDWPKNAVVSVDTVGLGFILTHREVFEKIAAQGYSQSHPWFDNGQRGPAGQTLSDDSSFCFRAKEVGFDILVDTSAVIGHIKPRVLRGP